MASSDPARAHLGGKLALVLTSYVLAATSFVSAPIDTLDRMACLIGLTLMTAFWVVVSRRGAPHTTSEYLSYVWIGVAIAAIAAAVAVAHLTEGENLPAAIAAAIALLLVGVSGWIARFALFIRRLPRLLDPEERVRAFAIGIVVRDDLRKRGAVLVTTRRVLLATPRGGTPRLLLERDRSRLGQIDLIETGGSRQILLSGEGETLAVTDVPPGQAVDLAAALGCEERKGA